MSSPSPTLLPALEGPIRDLRTCDIQVFRDHLLRLKPASRRDRFNGYTDDTFVEAYAARCFDHGVCVIGYVVEGRIRGAAELHGLADAVSAEVAFSVDDDLQHRGIGALLFERLIVAARERGYRTLHVTTHPQNSAMKALARRFGAHLCFHTQEAVGVIDLTQVVKQAGAPALPPPGGTHVLPSPLVAAAGVAGTFIGAGRAALRLYSRSIPGKP